MSNNTEALDLYAKVEDLLAIKEAAPKLYKEYFELLKDIEFDSLLDIGCGDGEFLSIIDSINICSYILGVDKSLLMVQKAIARGVNAKTLELKEINREFDLATATFDMINYLTFDEFEEFFSSLAKVVKKGGYFIFDINSYFAFSEVAVGNFIAQDESRFLSIESFFEDDIYESFWTLFEKVDKNLFKKEEGQINQYFYSLDKFKKLKNWEFIKSKNINLYDFEKNDKILIVLKRV